jgi:MFS family permease
MTDESKKTRRMGVVRWIARLFTRRTPRYAPVRHDEAPEAEPSPAAQVCFLAGRHRDEAHPDCVQRSGQSFVNHITVVIFLEFFAWGLVTAILPEVSLCRFTIRYMLTQSIVKAIKQFFGVERMWLVLGLTQGLKGFLSFLSAPLLGAMSDKYGRKPFLLLTVACTCLPLPFLLLNNLWWHIVAVAVSGAFAVTFSIVFAYVSDVTTAEERSAAFGQVGIGWMG